ncbi:hypothetical protein ANN_04961 [Periplaneta americana]|uniref:Uncharacterized protein n=1 Tax=Periplaneta americana TaxID=6978 RepID=A0ABQ8T9V3_PERAM|nr:hypothetical protein ANN_04961 [Periplaneta americana]
MSPGSSTESYPAFAHIGLRENPGKNLNQVTISKGIPLNAVNKLGRRRNGCGRYVSDRILHSKRKRI